jgi:hypothetical protein
MAAILVTSNDIFGAPEKGSCLNIDLFKLIYDFYDWSVLQSNEDCVILVMPPIQYDH